LVKASWRGYLSAVSRNQAVTFLEQKAHD